jgi:hypothetical protein
MRRARSSQVTFRSKQDQGNKKSSWGNICSRWSRIILSLLLSFGTIFGFILIFSCGTAQYGLSMLSSVFQGTITIILSLEIKGNVTQKQIQPQQTKYLLYLSLSYFVHFFILKAVDLIDYKCLRICDKYFIEHLQIQSRWNTTSLFTTVADCNEQCILSMYFFEYSILSAGGLHMVECLIMAMYSQFRSAKTSAGA